MATIKVNQASIDELKSAISFSAKQTSQAADLVAKAVNGISGMSFSAKYGLESDLTSLKNRLNKQAQLSQSCYRSVQEAVGALAQVDDSAGTLSAGAWSKIMSQVNTVFGAVAAGLSLATKVGADKQFDINNSFIDGDSSLIVTPTPDIGRGTQERGKNSSIVNIGTSEAPQYDMSEYVLCQADDRWATKVYDPSCGATYGGTGCLVSAVAEVESFYQGQVITPPEAVSRLALQFQGGNLTHDSAKAAGFTPETVNNDTALDRIYELLKDGPVIVGGKSESGNSHYMVISGYTGNGRKPYNAADFKLVNNSRFWSELNTLQSFMTQDRKWIDTVSGIEYNDKWPYLTQIYYKSK